MASPTAPVALDASEPVTFSFPVSAVVSDSTSWPPVDPDRSARGGPADVGVLQNLRHRVVGLAGKGARRAAVGRVADGGDGNGDLSQDHGTAGGGRQRRQVGHRRRATVPRGENQSIAFRLTKNETAITAIASRMT